jgi:hypothetical protein
MLNQRCRASSLRYHMPSLQELSYCVMSRSATGSHLVHIQPVELGMSHYLVYLQGPVLTLCTHPQCYCEPLLANGSGITKMRV